MDTESTIPKAQRGTSLFYIVFPKLKLRTKREILLFPKPFPFQMEMFLEIAFGS